MTDTVVNFSFLFLDTDVSCKQTQTPPSGFKLWKSCIMSIEEEYENCVLFLFVYGHLECISA